MPHFERECKREKLLRCGGSCWESTEAAWGISALSGNRPLLQSLLPLSALQARKASHIPGSCLERWKEEAEERAASGGLALGALSQGKAHMQSMKNRQRLLQPGNHTVHPPVLAGYSSWPRCRSVKGKKGVENNFLGAIKQRMKSHLTANTTSVLSVEERIKSSAEMQWERRGRLRSQSLTGSHRTSQMAGEGRTWSGNATGGIKAVWDNLH